MTDPTRKEILRLQEYAGEEPLMLEVIKRFWIAHNDYTQTEEESREDLRAWTAAGHRLYWIMQGETSIGLLHMGSRGAEIDWIEDLFILPEYQGRGYGSEALMRAEEIVKEYSESIYLEVAARNLDALRLYRRRGYDCLNTVTIRKDFHPENFETVSKETLLGSTFAVRRYRK